MMTGLGIASPGELCLILGTTAVVTHVMAPHSFEAPPLGATLHHPFTSDWIRGLAPQSGASAFDWFAALHPNSFSGKDAEEVAQKIIKVAKTVPPGANGVLFLPFLTGERAPFVAPEASGSFHGMRADTTQADLARAVMEGTALSLRHCLQAEELKRPERVVLTGGGARNPLWCQIVADVLGLRIFADPSEDHGMWGAALMGGAAAGVLDPLTSPRIDDFDAFEPNREAVETYDRLFDTYVKVVDASYAIWDAMRT
jgi:sugar (pentulose or hexulose) kinase